MSTASRTHTPATEAFEAPSTPFAAAKAKADSYLRTRVLTATPEELRLMLLDGAIKFAHQGLDGMQRKDFEAMYLGVSQCRNIVFELLTTIRTDADPELAANVRGLYTFMYTHLLEASHEKNAQKLERIIELLTYERETWALLMQKVSADKSSPAPAPVNGGAKATPAAGAARPTLSVQG